MKDAQQVEPEGQEKPVPAAVRSVDPATTKDPKAASEMSGDIGAMISVPAAEYGTDVKVSCTPWVHVRPETALVLACSAVCFCWWLGVRRTTWVISTEQIYVTVCICELMKFLTVRYCFLWKCTLNSRPFSSLKWKMSAQD